MKVLIFERRDAYISTYIFISQRLILNRKERNNKILADVRYTRSIATILPFVKIPSTIRKANIRRSPDDDLRSRESGTKRHIDALRK